MGKKRIKTIDLSAEEKKEKPEKSRRKVEVRRLSTSREHRDSVGDGRRKVSAKGQAIVRSGKQHGRIADMSTVMLEEMEKRRKTEEAEKAPPQKKIEEPKLKKKVSRPKKFRSRRYQSLRKLIKSDKLYPLSEAIELLKKIANAKFDETVELHLVTTETGNLGKGIKTEKKSPLAHLKIGKISLPKEKLETTIQSFIKAINVNRIEKAVLTTTMGPGIKIDISLLKE